MPKKLHDNIVTTFDLELETEDRNTHHLNNHAKEEKDTGPSLFLKYTSLLCLVVQTIAVVTVLRWSRLKKTDHGEPLYLNTSAVFFSEIFKFFASFVLITYENQWNVSRSVLIVYTTVVNAPLETLSISIPALLYTIQNNLIFIALSHIPAAAYQVTYQLKILTTALLSVLILQKKINLRKWGALLCLTVGVSLAEWPTNSTDNITSQDFQIKSNHIIGISAVLLACVTSGLAGVYFEKMLKKTPTSVWFRNLQLAFFGTALSLFAVYWNDGEAVKQSGFLQGYNITVWIVILLQSVGGLIVAAVLKYADNILKCFANAIALLVTFIIGFFILQDTVLSLHFFIGSILVLLSSVTYSMDDFYRSKTGSYRVLV